MAANTRRMASFGRVLSKLAQSFFCVLAFGANLSLSPKRDLEC